MAGQRGYYRYIDDFGKVYVVQIDRSKAQATINGIPLIPSCGNHCGEHLPNSMRLRYLTANSINGKWKNIEFIVGHEAAIIQVKSPRLELYSSMYANQPQIAWNVTAYYPEWQDYRFIDGVPLTEYEKKSLMTLPPIE
jgi:hypothetical protein